MLEKNLSEQILSIGNRSDRPDGGISQVLYNYRFYVFPVFKSITNFKIGSKPYKLFIAILALLKEFLILIFDKKIKIVHVHAPSDIGFRRSSYYIYLAKIFHKKIIVHIHSGRFNDYYLRHRKYVEHVFSKCDVIVALTKEIKKFYEAMGCTNVVLINNIIEVPIEKNVRYEDGLIHLLFLGSITEPKGIYDLVDVLCKHRLEFEGRIILHVGGNREVDKLLHIIETKRLDNLIKYEGWLSGERKIEMLNKCNVFILPSHTEGLPISDSEAFSYGKYVVATNVGGIPEIINHVNGVMFNPMDKDALYKVLSDLLQNGLSFVDNNAIKKTVYEYMPESVEKQLSNLYNSIIDGQ